MILSVPYFDPHGRHNTVLQRQLPTLQSTFATVCVTVCVSVAPPTDETNAAMVQFLVEQGCAVVHNPPGSSFGEHSRAALGLALQHATHLEPIVFGFLDRILFALETAWRDPFLADLAIAPEAELLVYERSVAAWATHPANYHALEQMVSQQFALLWGDALELSPAVIRFRPDIAETIVAPSHVADIAIWSEWLLLARQHAVPITAHAVDWLAWEDPFWEATEPHLLQRQREASRNETRKRIRWNVPIMQLFADERFSALRPRIQRYAGSAAEA